MTRPLVVNLVLALFLTPGAHAQSSTFGVYFTSGMNTYIPFRGPVRPLETHTFIIGTDKLTLSDNIAQVILFAQDTTYIQLEGKGTYTGAAIGKLPRHPIRDPMVIRYFSLFWSSSSALSPSSPAPSHVSSTPYPSSSALSPVSSTPYPSSPALSSVSSPPSPDHSSVSSPRSPTPSPHPLVSNSSPRPGSFVIGPGPVYTTSMDSVIFNWHNVSWARKYFLRLRSSEGDLRYDSVLVDTQAVVHFSGHLQTGNSYNWAIDIVGEGGRLQFADSGHIIWLDETKVLPQLPPLTKDSLGGIAVILEEIEQYENAGCIHQADILFQRLVTDYPMDAALDKLYTDFRKRNYY